MADRANQGGKLMARRRRRAQRATDDQMRPDWTHKCEVCGAVPIVPLTGMCGPCTWGEADTVAGGWWTEPVQAGEEGDRE